MFLVLDPDPDPLAKGMDTDPNTGNDGVIMLIFCYIFAGAERKHRDN
jgi:hypothetical protein